MSTSPVQSPSAECKPLFEVAHADLYLENPFRVTGLQVDASVKEIGKHVANLKMLEELGQGAGAHTAAFALNPPPSVDKFREAIARLKDPEKRLMDEFFWFWPEQFGESSKDAALQAIVKGDRNEAYRLWIEREENSATGFIATHNLAVLHHLVALDWTQYQFAAEVDEDRQEKIKGYWSESFKHWKGVAVDDRVWDQVKLRIRSLDDARLTIGFSRRMRAALPYAIGKINGELAVRYAESGRMDLAQVHVQFMREINQGPDRVEKTAELVLAPATTRLKQQIQRAQQRAAENPADAINAARELVDHARRALALFELFFGQESDARNEISDEIAALCNRLQVDYHKATGDNKGCLDLLKMALPFGTSIELRRQIQENIGTLTGNLTFKQLEPIYAILEALQASSENPIIRFNRFNTEVVPAISKVSSGRVGSEAHIELVNSAAIVLRAISLDAWNTHQDMPTAVAANELAVKYAVGQELKQRLAEDKATLQQMVVKKAAAKRKKMKETVGWLVVIAIGIVWAINSCNSTNTSSSNTSYTPPPTPSMPAYAPPPVLASGNSEGNVYSVPSSVNSTLDDEKAEIESERITLDALNAQVETLGREIENDRLSLDATSQSAVDDFNAKVGRYNALAQKAKDENAAFNEKVDDYNAKLKRYGR